MSFLNEQRNISRAKKAKRETQIWLAFVCVQSLSNRKGSFLTALKKSGISMVIELYLVVLLVKQKAALEDSTGDSLHTLFPEQKLEDWKLTKGNDSFAKNPAGMNE